MTTSPDGAAELPGGKRLPGTHGSLARGVSAPVAGTVFALALTGGMRLGPGAGREILFGRNRPAVHVCLGEDDPLVSRHQGTLTHRGGQWWISNRGRLPIRLARGRLLFTGEEPLPLDTGYTPLFVRGSRHREHLLEVYVTDADGTAPTPRPADITLPPRTWILTAQERLVLVVLGRRYLLHEVRPQPLTWQDTAAHLARLQPGASWGPKKVEHVVSAVRTRLSRDGVPYLTREEIGEPVGNTLNDHLLRELLLSTTLVPPDLALLDVRPDDDTWS
ncbi:FHA domain-containing protein [Streptomyces sp. IBSBF 2435]|uniref:FHA domain-containing protein n=1 Tax=Streptomyces sp. IBSBF 2435 TaxID=2903531 RepID=UPI002FDBA20F